MIKKFLFGLVTVAALSIGFAFFYRFYFLHFFVVPTGAMANTVIPGDHLIVKKRGFGEIGRGDVIVFRYPNDSSTLFLARVIGLPGETIEIRDRLIYIDNQELKEHRVTVKQPANLKSELEEISSDGAGEYRVFYFSRDSGDLPFVGGEFGVNEPFRIPDDHCFVMGDNRDNSSDSRYRGPVMKGGIFWKSEDYLLVAL